MPFTGTPPKKPPAQIPLVVCSVALSAIVLCCAKDGILNGRRAGEWHALGVLGHNAGNLGLASGVTQDWASYPDDPTWRLHLTTAPDDRT